MNPQDLISGARLLAHGNGRRGRPRQADLCRAVSTAYYALFHTLAGGGADLIAGATRRSRSRPAWEQTYRALEHGHARNQCRNHSVMARFPPAVQDFAGWFMEVQRYRHYADYAPVTAFSRANVVRMVDTTEGIIARFNAAPAGERRAFAIYVLLRVRRE